MPRRSGLSEAAISSGVAFGFDEREVRHLGRRFEQARLKRELPPLHVEHVAAGAVVLVEHVPALDDRLLARARIVDVLSRRRLAREPQHERHHLLALFRVEREQRHPQPFVVALRLGGRVVEAPRHPQLLPEEAHPLMRIERLQEETGVRIEVERIEAVAATVLGMLARAARRMPSVSRPCVSRNTPMFSNASCDTSLRPQLASGVPIGFAPS